MAASMRKIVGLLKAYGVAVTEDVSLTFRNASEDEAHGKQTGGDCPGPVINEDCSFNGDGDEEANSDDADNDNADNDDADNDEDNDKPAEKSETSRHLPVDARGVKRKADCYKVNFEGGGDDFIEVSDGELNPPVKQREHVSSPRRFDQGDEAGETMFLEIIRVVNLAKEKWGGRKVSESLVGRFLKEAFSAKKFYRNIDLASKAQHATGQLTIFITMPGVVNSTRGRRVELEDLRDLEKAKYMFFPGYGSGSLVDLVVGRHGTSFPSDFVGVWASNPNEVTGNNVRKDRTSGRGGFRWV